MSEDTQFAGFASLLFADLDSMFNNLVIERADCDYETAEKTEQGIKDYIANRAYDLAQHTIGYSLEYVHECGHTMPGSMGARILPSIPDITTWPEEKNN